MPDDDLAIRGGTVVTAPDTTRADVGGRDGRILQRDLSLYAAGGSAAPGL